MSRELEELIATKEAALEGRLWEGVYTFEEMAMLLAALDRREPARNVDPVACRQRAAMALAKAARLRSIIQADRPVALSTSAGHGAGPGMSS